MKPKIKRTKQPDVVEYLGETVSISGKDREISLNIDFSMSLNNIKISPEEAKELAEILPKFLEQMERTK